MTIMGLLLRAFLIIAAHALIVGLAVLCSGCTVTYIHRDEKSATAFRGSLGTDQTLGELTLNDGDGASLQIKRHVSTQTEGLNTAGNVAGAALIP